MDYVSVIIEAFWQYHIHFAAVLVPAMAIFWVYKMLRKRM